MNSPGSGKPAKFLKNNLEFRVFLNEEKNQWTAEVIGNEILSFSDYSAINALQGLMGLIASKNPIEDNIKEYIRKKLSSSRSEIDAVFLHIERKVAEINIHMSTAEHESPAIDVAFDIENEIQGIVPEGCEVSLKIEYHQGRGPSMRYGGLIWHK